MSELDEAKRQIEALRERVSRLCAAVGHITASLDLETVLRGILYLPAIAPVDQAVPIGPHELHHRKAGSVLHPERESRETLESARWLAADALSAE